jgi:hypothetical protein
MKGKRGLVIGTAAAVAVCAASGAVAAIPDSTGTISSCYDNASGAVRVIDTAVTSTCPSGSTKLRWSQRNVHWVHLRADGSVIARSDSDSYQGKWGTGRYYAGFPSVDFSKCAVSVEPVLPYDPTPVFTHMYMPSYGYALVELKRIRPSSWPIAYDFADAEVFITASCAQ